MFEMNTYPFHRFGLDHLLALFICLLLIIGLYILQKNSYLKCDYKRPYEKIFAGSLLVIEVSKYIWEWKNGLWETSNSLPLELCTISLYAAILLLWTNHKKYYPFVLFAGIGGAIQALLTPDLDYGFPHFRFFHFFYLHIAIILTALYFTWIKDLRPTFKKLLETMVLLNIIAVIVFMIDQKWQANYMFLLEKPAGGSLLDFLGPYPYYIVSLEGIAFMIFVFIWLLFKK